MHLLSMDGGSLTSTAALPASAEQPRARGQSGAFTSTAERRAHADQRRGLLRLLFTLRRSAPEPHPERLTARCGPSDKATGEVGVNRIVPWPDPHPLALREAPKLPFCGTENDIGDITDKSRRNYPRLIRRCAGAQSQSPRWPHPAATGRQSADPHKRPSVAPRGQRPSRDQKRASIHRSNVAHARPTALALQSISAGLGGPPPRAVLFSKSAAIQASTPQVQ